MKFLLALLLISAELFAAQIVPNPDFQVTFDNLQGIPAARKYKLGSVIREAHTTAVCVYDFATQGGAIGQIKLLARDLITPCLLPGKAVVRNGFVDVTTALTSSGSATVSFSSGKTDADLRMAIAYTSLTASQYSVSPAFATVSTYLKLTNANTIVNGVNLNAYQPYITVATAALTAGHLRVFIDYSISE